MRVVLDSNVLLAAFGTHGLCEALVEECLQSHVLVCSDHILRELEKYLGGKFKVPAGEVREIVRFVREHSEVAKPSDEPADACPDPDDLPVLGTAVAGGADLIATGDAVLLAIEAYKGIPILTVRACYERVSAVGPVPGIGRGRGK
ncbi:MAG TPA: putative toxin-antitoxin system toxin component, PIN family [Anaeromyxobacteraceae bacterium]|nr:putative toxin-antitoxin system toxin component, PIN family [Anaeromyxobacteraceae bacterium]